jgi:hypothetical protein
MPSRATRFANVPIGADAPIGASSQPEAVQRRCDSCLADAGRRARVGGRDLTCAAIDRDRYGRTVATCSVGGQDVGAAMGRSGLGAGFRALQPRRLRGRAARRRTRTARTVVRVVRAALGVATIEAILIPEILQSG